MAEKWGNQDSARRMTQKYNDTVDQVNKLARDNREYTHITDEDLKEIHKQLDEKVNAETARKDLNLDKVDNTPDSEKPMSDEQKAALIEATKDFITSVPSDMEELSPEVGVLVNLLVAGSKLILDTENAGVKHKVNVFVQNSKLVFVTI